MGTVYSTLIRNTTFNAGEAQGCEKVSLIFYFGLAQVLRSASAVSMSTRIFSFPLDLVK